MCVCVRSGCSSQSRARRVYESSKKAPVILVMSVRPSVLMNKLDSHCTDSVKF